MTGTVRGVMNGHPLRMLRAEDGEDFGSLTAMRLACDRFFRSRGLQPEGKWKSDFRYGSQSPNR